MMFSYLQNDLHCLTRTHTSLTALFCGTTQVSQYQKGKTNLDFTEARVSEWQWHQLGHMQVCTSLQTDNHASTSPLSFLQAGCPSCRPTNSIKALKAKHCLNLCVFTFRVHWRQTLQMVFVTSLFLRWASDRPGVSGSVLLMYLISNKFKEMFADVGSSSFSAWMRRYSFG